MCDTFVVMPSATADKSVIFGKNSDREPNEAQNLEYVPGGIFPENSTVRCTYIEIQQVKESYSVLISRPFWMWGAEMGANEKGVVIGNEAVFTKMPKMKEGVLTGMDMLRLALERAGTAEQALEILVQLLSDYGQGGIGGYEDKHMLYHNSFIIADPGAAWVLETAGHLWAAKKINDYYAISNGLTIGEQFDESHPELIETAKKKGWLKKGETFHFANCYSDWFYTTFSACRRRERRSLALIKEKHGNFNFPAAIASLRDHPRDDYRPDSHFLGNTICAHAGNPLSRKATQTVGSLVAHLQKDSHTYWVTASSAPCTAVFKPVWFGEKSTLPELKSAESGEYDPDVYWWQHELLHRSVLPDYQRRLNAFKQDRDALENELMGMAQHAKLQNRREVTGYSFRHAKDKTVEWTEKIKNLEIKNKPNSIYRHYWRRQNKKAKILKYLK